MVLCTYRLSNIVMAVPGSWTINRAGFRTWVLLIIIIQAHPYEAAGKANGISVKGCLCLCYMCVVSACLIGIPRSGLPDPGAAISRSKQNTETAGWSNWKNEHNREGMP